MAKYVCSVCGYIYDEAKGIPEVGIAPSTTREELPEDWVCLLCGATKSEIEKQGVSAATPGKKTISVIAPSTNIKEMSPLEVSALILTRGKKFSATSALSAEISKISNQKNVVFAALQELNLLSINVLRT